MITRLMSTVDVLAALEALAASQANPAQRVADSEFTCHQLQQAVKAMRQHIGADRYYQCRGCGYLHGTMVNCDCNEIDGGFEVLVAMPESVNVQVQTDEAHTKVVEDNWQQTMHDLEVSRKQELEAEKAHQ